MNKRNEKGLQVMLTKADETAEIVLYDCKECKTLEVWDLDYRQVSSDLWNRLMNQVFHVSVSVSGWTRVACTLLDIKETRRLVKGERI